MKKILNAPALVGREKQLEELSRDLQTVIEGKGKTVFISAEAGIGKTRLVTEFLKSVRHENIIKLSGWCLFNAEIPYFPFIEAFSNYCSTLGEEGSKEEMELNSWLKTPTKGELPGHLKYLSPQALKEKTFTAVAKTIHLIAAQNPVILVMEDIHWADSASLALLHYIARAIHDSEKVMVLATFRSEELTSDIEGYPHQLVQTLSMMRREDLFKEIDLPSLNQSCTTKMAESMLRGALRQDFAEKLANKSDGNPLFLVESLRMLHEQESLVRENNEWRLAAEEIEIPSKIRDIMIRRLAKLTIAQRRVLNAASVIGEEFEAGLLSAMVDQDTLDVLETLNEIVQSTSIICIDEDRFRFDHALSREIVYGATAKPLRQAYHNRLAEKIEGSKNSLLPLSDLAYHYAKAANKEKAMKYALAAGQNELARWSNIEAIKHFTYVLQAIGQDSKRAKTKEIALEGLGDSFYIGGLFQKATKAFEKLGDTARTGIVKLRAFRKAGESAFQQGDPLRVLELVKKTEPYAAIDRLEKARVLVCRSRALMLQSKTGYKKDLENALQVFEEEYSLWDIAWTLMDVAGCYAGRGIGKDHQGLAEALRSIALFDELGDSRSQMEECYIAGYAFINCLLYEEALNVYAKIIAINENMKMDDYLHTCYAYAWSGVLSMFYMEDYEKGLAYNLKALELSKKTDSLVAQGVVYSNLVRIYVLSGDMKHAEEYLQKLMKFPLEIFNFNPVNGEFARAVFLAGNGQWNAFEELLEKMKAAPYPYWSGWLQGVKWTYARMLERQGRVEEARIQSDEVKRIQRDAEGKFEHVNMQASLMVRRHVIVGEEFEMHFDLVNVGKKPCTVIEITDAIPSEFNVVSLPSFCSLQKGGLLLKQKVVDPFKVETIKLKVKASKADDYNISAKVVFMDDLDETKTSKLSPISITAKGVSSSREITSIQSLKPGEFEFSSEAAEKAFKYLVTAFKEDQMKPKLPEEKKGWRTLREISRNAHITTYSMYGRYGRGGEATRELRLLDIVESRVFLGERARGGRATKMRIRYGKPEQLIDEQKNK